MGKRAGSVALLARCDWIKERSQQTAKLRLALSHSSWTANYWCGVHVVCLPIFFTDPLIARWVGGLFLGYYVAYTTYLVLAATFLTISRTFGSVMLAFVIPLTVITLIRGVVRSLRRCPEDVAN